MAFKEAKWITFPIQGYGARITLDRTDMAWCQMSEYDLVVRFFQDKKVFDINQSLWYD